MGLNLGQVDAHRVATQADIGLKAGGGRNPDAEGLELLNTVRNEVALKGEASAHAVAECRKVVVGKLLQRLPRGTCIHAKPGSCHRKASIERQARVARETTVGSLLRLRR
jgi:hypothetical protein